MIQRQSKNAILDTLHEARAQMVPHDKVSKVFNPFESFDLNNFLQSHEGHSFAPNFNSVS